MAKKTGMFYAFGQFFSFISTLMGLLEKSVKGVDRSMDDGIKMMNATTRNLREDLENDFLIETAEREQRREEIMKRVKSIKGVPRDGVPNSDTNV